MHSMTHWVPLTCDSAHVAESQHNCPSTVAVPSMCTLQDCCRDSEGAACLQAEAQCYIGSSDCPDYLKKAEKRLGEEIERVVNYLDPSSEAHITKVVENELIGKQVCISAYNPQGTG